MQPVSNESSALSSASELARTLEDETDSFFRFLGTAVPLAELPAACDAGPDASAGAKNLFLQCLLYSMRRYAAYLVRLSGLIRSSQPLKKSNFSKRGASRVANIQRNFLTSSFKCRSKRWRSSI